VICPLAVDASLNAVLVVEYYRGEEFSHAIRRATGHGDAGHLYRRLTALAWFLATQHNRTANGALVDFAPACRYFDTVVGRLDQAGQLGRWEVEELGWLGGLAAIDLERTRRGDRMFDVGRVAGELQHAFMATAGGWGGGSGSSAISCGSTPAISPIVSGRSPRSPGGCPTTWP
jgi:hypothetical protein